MDVTVALALIEGTKIMSPFFGIHPFVLQLCKRTSCIKPMSVNTKQNTWACRPAWNTSLWHRTFGDTGMAATLDPNVGRASEDFN